MAFVAARCPACGGELRLDDQQKSGFCIYCGSQILVQDAVQKVRIDKSDDFENFTELSSKALGSGNGEDALVYANKALEIKPKSSIAWELKMRACVLLMTPQKLRLEDIKAAAKYTIDYISDADKTIKQNEVYTYLLDTSMEMIQQGINIITDVNGLRLIKQIYESNRSIYSNPSQATYSTDSNLIETSDDLVFGAVQIKEGIPVSVIEDNPEFQDKLADLLDSYDSYTASVSSRMHLYNMKLLSNGVAARQGIRRILSDGMINMPDNISSNVSMPNDNAIQTNLNNGACYIATVIYGSYDAPEVIAFRNYRDVVLSKTFFGRAFIKTYYFFSPPIANWLKDKNRINNIVHSCLDRILDYINGR